MQHVAHWALLRCVLHAVPVLDQPTLGLGLVWKRSVEQPYVLEPGCRADIAGAPRAPFRRYALCAVLAWDPPHVPHVGLEPVCMLKVAHSQSRAQAACGACPRLTLCVGSSTVGLI